MRPSATRCPQRTVGELILYQGHINQKYGTKFNIPVVYYSTLMSVAYGRSAKEAGLDGQVVRAKPLEAIANK